METPQASPKSDKKDFPAIVAKVIDDYTLVINRGEADGITNGQRFLIYNLSEEEILDPETGQTLGHLEIVKGSGRVTHIQERMSTIKSDRTTSSKRKIIRRAPHYAYGEEEEITPSSETIPFENARIGDKAKPI